MTACSSVAMLTHTTIPAAMLVSSSFACYAIMLHKNNTKPRLTFWLAAFVMVYVLAAIAEGRVTMHMRQGTKQRWSHAAPTRASKCGMWRTKNAWLPYRSTRTT
jgi:hypothetical protein